MQTILVARSRAMAEFALALGGFALGSGEFASMGLLPYVASSVHASIPSMGQMISAYALGVVVGAPVITVLAARAPRKPMLIVLMGAFALANLASAIGTSSRLQLLTPSTQTYTSCPSLSRSSAVCVTQMWLSIPTIRT